MNLETQALVLSPELEKKIKYKKGRGGGRTYLPFSFQIT